MKFPYAPRGQTTSHDNGSGEAGLAFEVKIHDEGDAIGLLRFHMRRDPDVTPADYEADALRRVRLLHEWLGRLSSLVGSVEAWAKELGVLAGLPGG